MSWLGSCRERRPRPEPVEPLQIEGRRVLFAQHADTRYERLTTYERALLQRAIATLRLLPSVHERASMLARLEGVSLNRLLSNAVSHYVGYLGGAHDAAPRRSTPRATAVAEDSPGYAS